MTTSDAEARDQFLARKRGESLTGHFAFTGDYTEAETRVLVLSLYKDPLRFLLQKIRDVEVPAH